MGILRAAFGCSAFALCASCLAGQVSSAPNSPASGQHLLSLHSDPKGLSTTDWSSIREAYEAARHAAYAAAGGYQARNPGHQWLTRFDGRGFSTEPDTGGWTWGLQLERYGFAGWERTVAEPTQVSTAGQRVAYDWDATLQEWYVNDSRGLEQGFTVNQRPPQDREGPLTLTLAVRGDLSARIQADRLGVNFVNGDGATVLVYAGLCVFDADGQALGAHFEPLGGGLLLTVDEAGARYPLTIDPIAEQAYLKASNTDAEDAFGSSVAVYGDTVVVGAPHEASSATGVNGNQSDNSAAYSGAAYVFVRDGSVWNQQAYLKSSNTDASDQFGFSVSISGNTVVVGAIFEASNATGVDGDQSNNSVLYAGAAYVFVRSGRTWSQQAYLKASNPGIGDTFGWSVAVSGDTAVVGAIFESSKSKGVNGDQNNNGASSSGAAYAFVRIGTSWSQQAYLKASNTFANNVFGGSVGVAGDTVVVGSGGESSDATGVNGNETNFGAYESGAAYVFVRTGVAWHQQAYMKASNTEAYDGFGGSVSISGDTVVVGAGNEESNATGVNGGQNNNGAPGSGAAYVFVRSGTTWSQQAYLKASNTDSDDRFGWQVSISGDTLVVGAVFEASNTRSVNGDQGDNSAYHAGAAYVFARSGTTWSQQAYLKASNAGGGDTFGDWTAVSGDTVVVGASNEDSNSTGVNGDQYDNSARSAGSVYVFSVNDSANPWANLGNTLAGSNGEPELAGLGSLQGGSLVTLSLTTAKQGAYAFLVSGFSEISAPFKGGIIVPHPDFVSPQQRTGPTGQIVASGVWPTGVPSGFATYFQWWVQDSAGPKGYAASNAISGTTP